MFDKTPTTEILTLKYYLPLDGKIRLYFYENPSKFYIEKDFDKRLSSYPKNKKFKVVFKGSRIEELEPIKNENLIKEKQDIVPKQLPMFLHESKIPILIHKLREKYPFESFLPPIEEFQGDCFKIAKDIRNDILFKEFKIDCEKIFIYAHTNIIISGKECGSKEFDTTHVAVMIETGNGENGNKKIIIDPYVSLNKVFDFKDWINEVLCTNMSLQGIDILPGRFYFLKDKSASDVLKLPENSGEFTEEKTGDMLLQKTILFNKQRLYQTELEIDE